MGRWLLTAFAIAVTGAVASGASSQDSSTSAALPAAQIVFQRSRGQDEWFQGGTWDIIAMAPNGSGIHVLTKNGYEPAASPDGRRIAFVRSSRAKPGGTEIWVMNAEGRGQRRLTRAARWNGSPAWSTDGTNLFFIRYRPVRDGQSAVFTMRSDGTGNRRVTAWDSGCEDGLDASPDGKLLAFEDYSCDRPSSGVIQAIDMRGRPVVILQELMRPAGAYLDWPGDPAWSPDGTRLAFSRIEGLGYGGAYVANVDGSNARRLAPPALQASSPAWSPDGMWIALARDRVLANGYPGDVWLVQSDGKGLHRITDTKRVDERNITWLQPTSPGGP
jgi:TolB protein